MIPRCGLPSARHGRGAGHRERNACYIHAVFMCHLHLSRRLFFFVTLNYVRAILPPAPLPTRNPGRGSHSRLSPSPPRLPKRLTKRFLVGCSSPFMRLVEYVTAGGSRLVQARCAWSVKTRRAPSRRCRDARVYMVILQRPCAISGTPPPTS